MRVCIKDNESLFGWTIFYPECNFIRLEICLKPTSGRIVELLTTLLGMIDSPFQVIFQNATFLQKGSYMRINLQ